jgi:hypothetical protein
MKRAIGPEDDGEGVDRLCFSLAQRPGRTRHRQLGVKLVEPRAKYTLSAWHRAAFARAIVDGSIMDSSLVVAAIHR